MSIPQNHKSPPVPFAFDPSSPLAIVTTPTPNSKIITTYSHEGIGSTPPETTCILSLLDARDAIPNPATLENLQSLSENYLSSLQLCLERWDAAAANNATTGDNNNNNVDSSSGENLSHLSVIASVTHISTIYALANPQDLQNPGALTSSTVDYLRKHFVHSPFDEDNYREILNGSNPEYHPSYFPLLHSLVRRGDLTDAWAVLSRHSRCRACFDDGEEETQDRIGFEYFYRLLTESPIPGMDERWDELSTLGTVRASWDAWRRELTTLISVGMEGGLTNRVPQLQTCLEIMAGREEGKMWAERLLMELLYVRPHVVGVDIPIRMKSQFDEDEEGPYERILISIMEGDVGKAIEALHGLGGGGGAALPSTMTALLADMLLLAGRLPFLDFSMRRELFLNAAMACRSSFHSLGHVEVGVRCAARLLQVSGDLESLAELIEASFPMNDAIGKELLSFVEKGMSDATEKEKMMLNEAGRGVALARWRSLWREEKPGGAVYWLLKARKYGNSLDTNEGGQLEVVCQETTGKLLECLVQKLFGEDAHITHWYLRAKEMQKVLEEGEETGNAITVLKNVIDIVDGLESKDYSSAALALIDCLEDGDSLSKASLTLWIYLFQVSYYLLTTEKMANDKEGKINTVIFDVHGIQTLLGRLTIIEGHPEGIKLLASHSSDENVDEDPSSPFSLDKFRAQLGMGLMRAFVKKNQEIRKVRQRNRVTTPNASIRSDKIADLMLTGLPPSVV